MGTRKKCGVLVMVTLVLTFGTLAAQNSETAVSSSHCTTKDTCGACIRTPGCAWCSQPVQVAGPGSARCVLESIALKDQWCPARFLEAPQSQVNVLLDNPLQARSGAAEDAVQIRPQLIRVKLRPGIPVNLHLQYSQATDYPVDLYYLMDLSSSMLDDKEKLSSLGVQLAQAMQQLTSNFRLGFGSFVDKREMPFVNTVPKKLESPCENCSSPYSFKNHMPLNDDTSLFSNEVKRARVSGNIDSPEGGLDALMQAITCTTQIGWRPKARHMIVFSTDADFHMAGDGKLAGIVEPNDETCHLDEAGEYTHGLLQDYPSISQINNKAKEHNMNIIFAVVSSVNKTYRMLKDRIEGALSGVLANDSSNVVNFVSQQYGELVQSVMLTDDADVDNIRVKYFATCPNSTVQRETNSCKGLRKGTLVNFTAEITVLKCPENRQEWQQRFEIKPQALNESVVVEIEMDCDCKCERSGNQGAPRQCSGRGRLQCGVCVCSPGYVGRECECSESAAVGGDSSDSSSCRADTTSELVCSGRGECKCGACQCSNDNLESGQRVYGKFCECDNFKSCGVYGGLVCSDHGTCECGHCKCKPGWEGDNCECPSDKKACMPQVGKDGLQAKECSGNGECKCGKCECRQVQGHRYNGKFCEDCPLCAGQCKQLLPCVQLMAYQQQNTGITANECRHFQLHNLTTLDGESIAAALRTITSGGAQMLALQRETRAAVVEEDFNLEVPGLEQTGEGSGETIEPEQAPNTGEPNAANCSHPDLAGCTYNFRYLYIDNKLHVFAQTERECSSEGNILAVVLGVIGGILLAGLLLLVVWKAATTVHDRREYARFEDERKNAKWDRGDNPIYKQATSTFSNPTFSNDGNSTIPQ